MLLNIKFYYINLIFSVSRKIKKKDIIEEDDNAESRETFNKTK